jgi:hypothetical protein
MKLPEYLPTQEAIVLTSQAEQVGASAAILKAVELRRDELRAIVESNPKHNPQELSEDVDFLLGGIRELNWILGLPQRSRDFMNKFEKRR